MRVKTVFQENLTFQSSSSLVRFTAGLPCAVWAAEVTCSTPTVVNSTTSAATSKKNLGAFDKVSNRLSGNISGALIIRSILQSSNTIQYLATQFRIYSAPCPSVSRWVQEHVQKCAVQHGHQQPRGGHLAGKSKPSGTRHEQGSLFASALQIYLSPVKMY